MTSTQMKLSPVLNTKQEEFRWVFGRFDADGDGKISPAELRLLKGKVGEELSPEDAEAVVGSTDSDGDGLLDFDDFIRLVSLKAGEEEGEEDKELLEAFGMYEMEGQGCITANSLKRMLSRLGTSRNIEECKTMICTFDLDGDEVLSFEEFRAMMLSEA